MKKCNKCKGTKPLTDYHASKGSIDGHINTCKKCELRNCLDRKTKESYIRYKDKTIYIYIITHPKFKGWVKIGRAVNIQKRLDSYQTGCPLREYELEYYLKVKEPREYEHAFNYLFTENKYEWFEINVGYAKELIDKIYKLQEEKYD